MADGDETTSDAPVKGTILDQAKSAINKQMKDAIVNKAKDIYKRRAEAAKSVALCDQELQQLLEDYQAGLL